MRCDKASPPLLLLILRCHRLKRHVCHPGLGRGIKHLGHPFKTSIYLRPGVFEAQLKLIISSAAV